MVLPLQARVNLGAMAKKGVICFPQSSCITATSPSDCLVSYPEHSLEGRSYSSAEMQSVYSTAPHGGAFLFWNIHTFGTIARFYDLPSSHAKRSNSCGITEIKQWRIFAVFRWAATCNILTSDRAGLSDEKCTCENNRCIRSKISGDNLDCRRVELSTNVTLARSRWVSNYYITPATGSSDQLEKMLEWEPCPRRGCPPGPRLSSPGERERNAAVARRVGGQYVAICSVSDSPLTDNTFRNPFQPFQIKWDVYFSKELCPLVFIVLNMFLHASEYEYVAHLQGINIEYAFFTRVLTWIS